MEELIFERSEEVESFDSRSHHERCCNFSSRKYRSCPWLIVGIEKGCSDQKEVQDLHWENQEVNHSFSLHYAAWIVFRKKCSPK